MLNSRFFKFIWGVNGLLIFLLAVTGVLFVALRIFDELSDSSYEYSKGVILQPEKKKSRQLDPELQHLYYVMPQKIPYSDFYISGVYVMDREIPESAKDMVKRANDVNPNLFGGMVNILFFRNNPDRVYPLLDGFGYIKQVDLPYRYNASAMDEKEHRKYILYKISLEDSNGDGRINDKDRSAYYVSALNGKNLRQITPDSLNLSYWIDRDDHNKIYFSRVKKEKMLNEFGLSLKTRYLYSYDYSTNVFRPLDRVQAVFDSLQKAYEP